MRRMKLVQKTITIPHPIAKEVEEKIEKGNFRGWSEYITDILRKEVK